MMLGHSSYDLLQKGCYVLGSSVSKRNWWNLQPEKLVGTFLSGIECQRWVLESV